MKISKGGRIIGEFSNFIFIFFFTAEKNLQKNSLVELRPPNGLACYLATHNKYYKYNKYFHFLRLEGRCVKTPGARTPLNMSRNQTLLNLLNLNKIIIDKRQTFNPISIRQFKSLKFHHKINMYSENKHHRPVLDTNPS